MRTKKNSWAAWAGLVGAYLATGAIAAEPESASKASIPSTAAWAGLFDVAGKLPSLSGLIRPEKMGVLTDNQVRVHDNEPKLLSDNDAELNLLSGNVVHLLSDLHFLSGISINVQVNVPSGDSKAPSAEASQRHGKSKARQAGKHGAARKPKRARP
jgi:hypothetical protein